MGLPHTEGAQTFLPRKSGPTLRLQLQDRLPLLLEPPRWAGQMARSECYMVVWGRSAWAGRARGLVLAVLAPSSAPKAFYVFYL